MSDSQLKKKTLMFKILIGLLCFAVIVLAFFMLKTQSEKFNSIQTHDPQKSAKEFKYKPELEIDVMYLPTCTDCQQIEKDAVDQIRNKNNINFIIANGNTNKGKRFILANDTSSVPTFLVKYEGHNIYKYSGTNKTKIHKIIDGKDPETSKRFNKYPDKYIYNDDFHHKTIVKAYK